MNPVVEKPSAERVKAACTKYDRENQLIEHSLEELVRQYPRNSDPRHVLLKVVAVNSLHHTHIFAVDAVARHIHADIPEIDSALAAGSPEVVSPDRQSGHPGQTLQSLFFRDEVLQLSQPRGISGLRSAHRKLSMQPAKGEPFWNLQPCRPAYISQVHPLDKRFPATHSDSADSHSTRLANSSAYKVSRLPFHSRKRSRPALAHSISFPPRNYPLSIGPTRWKTTSGQVSSAKIRVEETTQTCRAKH